MISRQVAGVLCRPDVARSFTHAAAVLGVIDVRSLAAEPQGLAGGLAYGALHLWACFTQA